jgi:arabinan endo-1,5-alpha-L-arabinosidase
MRLGFRNTLFAAALTALCCFTACSDDDDVPELPGGNGNGSTEKPGGSGSGEIDATLPSDWSDWSAPTYRDDYTHTGDNLQDWSSRAKWNLANVHDPSVAYYDGYYYMYGTDASYGNVHEGHGHFQGKRSKDLINWEWVPGMFYNPPTWVKDTLNSIRGRMNLEPIENPTYGYWAPVVRVVDGKLRAYYCIVVDNYIKSGKQNTAGNYDGSWTERSIIGMCETSDPSSTSNWEDKGYVITNSTDLGRDGWARKSQSNWEGYFYYNCIDPTYIETPEGNHWLIYGSWHSGFAAIEIDPATGKPFGQSTMPSPWFTSATELQQHYGIRIATRTANSRWQGSEAPEIIYKDGYYYLFMAYDGLDVPYNTRVVRSQSITGPYTDITGRNCTNGRGDCFPIVTHPYKFKGNAGWVGISHCCVFPWGGNAESGQWFYMSQGRLPQNANGNAYANANMMGHVRRLVWVPKSASSLNDLWPVSLPERYANVPNWTDVSDIKEADLVGTWEHINLNYQYGKQCASTELELKADGTMSGALSGSWSYDPATQYLTLGNAIVKIERELDWEATPRVATIVYAGYGNGNSANATYWGKKIK